jgi:hypothetical protein
MMARKTDASDPIALVRALLERLNLTTAARRLAELLAQAETAQPSYSAFLHTILEAEDGSRWERKLQRRRRWSRLGPSVTLDGFDWAARPQLSPQVVKELLTCRFIDEHRNVILVGRPSTGKTTVAKALSHAACARALSVYYAPMADVLQALHAARADGTYRTVWTCPGLVDTYPLRRGRGSQCPGHVDRTLRSSATGWSSWCAAARAPRSWHASSSPRPTPSGTGWCRPRGTQAAARMA